MYGKTYMPPRTVRRGPGIIRTLEAALKTARPDTVKMLAFNQLDLKNVPDIVYQFPNLEERHYVWQNVYAAPYRSARTGYHQDS